MILYLLVAVISLLPTLGVFWWMRNKMGDKDLCDRAFRYGLLTILPVLVLSGVSSLLVRFTGLEQTNPLLYQALHKFIVLALAEEVAKYGMFRYFLQKTGHTRSWLSAVVLMTTIAIGFSTIESVTLGIGANIPIMIVRGISFPHVGYGYLIGKYYGQGLKTRQPNLVWIGFALAWFLHGLYDFSLSEELIAINEFFLFLPFVLVAVDIILTVLLIRFVNKAAKDETYAQPISA